MPRLHFLERGQERRDFSFFGIKRRLTPLILPISAQNPGHLSPQS